MLIIKKGGYIMKLNFNINLERYSLSIVLIFILILLKPDTFILIMDQIINLLNVSGFMDFVLAITTSALQNLKY